MKLIIFFVFLSLPFFANSEDYSSSRIYVEIISKYMCKYKDNHYIFAAISLKNNSKQTQQMRVMKFEDILFIPAYSAAIPYCQKQDFCTKQLKGTFSIKPNDKAISLTIKHGQTQNFIVNVAKRKDLPRHNPSNIIIGIYSSSDKKLHVATKQFSYNHNYESECIGMWRDLVK